MIDVYGELAEPSRRFILAELRKGPKTVSQLVDATGLKQPNVSNHLARMRLRGTVRASKLGRLVYYSFSCPAVEAVVNSAMTSGLSTGAHVELSQQVEPFARAAVTGDHLECIRIVDEALSAGHDLVALYEDLLTPSMIAVGDWWEKGEVDEGQEHLATAICERMMARILHINVPQSRSEHLAVLGCAEGCQHCLGLRMVSDLLATKGWKCIYLGPNVPREAFMAAVRRYRPKMVLLSCSSSDSAPATLALAKHLRSYKEERPECVVGLGGWSVNHAPSLYEDFPVDFKASGIRDFANNQLALVEAS